MKITVTYPDCSQVGPDDWKSFTKVVHLNEDLTLAEAFQIITEKWHQKRVADVELHYDNK